MIQKHLKPSISQIFLNFLNWRRVQPTIFASKTDNLTIMSIYKAIGKLCCSEDSIILNSLSSFSFFFFFFGKTTSVTFCVHKQVHHKCLQGEIVQKLCTVFAIIASFAFKHEHEHELVPFQQFC